MESRASMTKPKLLIILGAGSSIEQGMPSVARLDASMRSWSQEWSAELNHAILKHEDYFEKLWTAAETYYGRVKPGRDRPTLNFERVLGDLVALAHWMKPPPHGNTLREITCDSAVPPHLTFPDGPFGAFSILMNQLASLLARLAAHMRALSRAPLKPAYEEIFRALQGAFDLGVYSLNYDNLALRACPTAFTGFAPNGRFDPRGVHGRNDWNFVYHLHGSVHYSLVGGEIRWRDDLGVEFDDGHPGQSAAEGAEGRSFPKTTLIAGGFKLDQLLTEPFHSSHAALVRHVYEADALLVAGYGFGDLHVNRALARRVRSPGRTPRVAVLSHAGPGEDPMAFRNDLWSWSLHKTFGGGADSYREPGHHSPPHVADLVAHDAFEVSTSAGVAIWHGGFLAAGRRIDAVVRWLQGEDDAIRASV